MFNLIELRRQFNSKHSTLSRGYEYYKSGAIKEVKLYQRFLRYEVAAQIQGTRLYKSVIRFNMENEYFDSWCSCPAFQQNKEPCKHIAALYSYLNESERFKKTFNYMAANDFLDDYFANVKEDTKHKINLEYQIQPHPSSLGNLSYLSLKIGQEKLYVVKNIRDFLDTVISGGVIEYGKRFIFNSRIHDFMEEDKNVLDFLLELYSAEKALKSDTYSSHGNIFTGKNVKLDDTLLVKFLKLLNGRSFSLISDEETIENVTAEFEKLPYEVIIKNYKDSITAEIKYHSECTFFRKSDQFIYSDKKLYIMDKSDKSLLFLKAARKNNVNSMEFSNEQNNRFLSIIPGLMQQKNIDVSQDILANYIKVPLEASIYLDKYKKGIKMSVEFKYADEKLDPIFNNTFSPYVIRDFETEESIISLIDDAGFKVNEDIVYLEDMDRIYLFFRDIVPLLSKYSNLYYTDDVRYMYMGKIKNYKSYASARQGGKVIDIDIDLEGIDKREIREILKSIKEKKKYHKLKSGKIISLEGDETRELSDLLESVDSEEIKNNGIALSKYRAINVFQSIREETKRNINNSEALDGIIKRIKNYNSSSIEIPVKFKNILRDYQAEGYRWMKTLSDIELCGILADDMGLGKTLQAITLMYGGSEKPSIVIAPSSLIYNWENEIRKFAPEMNILVVSGAKKTREEMLQELEGYDMVITSYPLLRRDIELYENIEFKYCILDEAQHIKNPDSINAQCAKRINANVKFALTGTPMENSLVELWSIFDFLMPDYLMSRGRFMEKFERPITREQDKYALEELKRMTAPFILRRKKGDVLEELPDKIETKLVCGLTDEQRGVYNAYLARTKEEIENILNEEGFNKGRIQILAALTRLRQICCHPSVFLENYNGGSGKLDLLDELLEELIEGGHRILLFSQFTSLLDIIKKALEGKGTQYMYLDGRTPVEDRIGLVNRFNNGEGKIFLISLKAGGTGLNITSADSVIHFDPWWNPAVEEQAADRAHRIGQKNVVQVFKMITKDTIEEKIFELQNKKKELINAVIQKGETFISRLTEEELKNILGI